jgi:CDP-diacylglycerol--serine O-phosphatidyltransferase
MNILSGDDTETNFNPVPSLFTLCNALCGITSIIFTFRAGDGLIHPLSIWLIFGAMLFDVLDGMAARLLNAQSLHGMNLDSLADVISFGAAPAVMIYGLIANGFRTDAFPGLAWFAASFYLVCALWRLAHYNSIALQETGDHGDFIGLPTPGAAALICSMAILVPALGPGFKLATPLYTSYAVVSAVLMVGAVPYTHVRRCLSHSRKWVAPMVLLMLIGSILLFKVWALVGWAHFYAFSAPLMALEARVMQRRHANI